MGKDLRVHLIPTPCHEQGTFHFARLLQPGLEQRMPRFMFYGGDTSFSTKPDFTRSVHLKSVKPPVLEADIGTEELCLLFPELLSALGVVPEGASLVHKHIPNSK